MSASVIDGYLLDARPAKAELVALLMREPAPDARAAPFYRALASVGPRAADETFVALRLVLAGRAADDAAVQRLRGTAALARAADAGRASDVAAAFARDGDVLADLRAEAGDNVALALAARAAYAAVLSGESASPEKSTR